MPCSSFKSPFARTERVVWKECTPIRLPAKSFGDSIPVSRLTYIWPALKNRLGNDGIPTIGNFVPVDALPFDLFSQIISSYLLFWSFLLATVGPVIVIINYDSFKRR